MNTDQICNLTYTIPVKLISPQPPSIKLIVHNPGFGRGNPNNAAAKPPACVTMQQAPPVATTPQVIHLFMDHHGSSNHRQLCKQCCLRFYHCMYFSFMGLKVAKVSWVVGVIFTMWIVVAASGVTPLAQVSVLMDVQRSQLWITLCGKAIELKKDIEFSMRIILL